MAIEQLPQAWEGTRATLQKYAQAMTALPRAGMPMDARWVHVSMALDATGLLSFSVPLQDGTELVSKIDLVDHQIVISTDDSFQVIGLESGPSPRSIGEAVLDAAAAHGSVFDVEEERFEEPDLRIQGVLGTDVQLAPVPRARSVLDLGLGRVGGRGRGAARGGRAR